MAITLWPNAEFFNSSAHSIANFFGFRLRFTELKSNNFGHSYGQKSKKYPLVVHQWCRNPSTICE